MDSVLAVDVGGRIRSARQRMHLSQVALAETLGIGCNAVRGIESNPFGAKVSTLVRVCGYLGLDVNYVLGLAPRSYVDDEGNIYHVRVDSMHG